MAGKHANWYPEPLVRASKEGHEIGNHTFNHPDISNLSDRQLEEEILKCEEILVKLTGSKPQLFRPPYGSYRQESLANIAKKLDTKVKSVDTAIQRIRKKALKLKNKLVFLTNYFII